MSFPERIFNINLSGHHQTDEWVAAPAPTPPPAFNPGTLSRLKLLPVHMVVKLSYVIGYVLEQSQHFLDGQFRLDVVSPLFPDNIQDSDSKCVLSRAYFQY